jgi:hypothetical protein
LSVVVYHDGIMAADTRAYSGDRHFVGNKLKIHRMPDGSLLGIVSNQVGMPEAFKQWVAEGADREAVMPDQPSFEAIHVMPDGKIFYYDDGYTPSGPIVAQTLTIGSGKKYALGAIKMGADAVRAVEIAIDCDVWCGAPVSALPLNEPRLVEDPKSLFSDIADSGEAADA